MDPAQACPRCGAPRLANAPAGLCPRCLLQNGLVDELRILVFPFTFGDGPRIFEQPTCHHRPEVYGGIGETRAGELLKAFFRAKR